LFSNSAEAAEAATAAREGERERTDSGRVLEGRDSEEKR
jgi:hypothetical protein